MTDRAGTTGRPSEQVDACEVCIVGAGITGLNALVVASSYLTRADTIVLADRRPDVGGMWVDTYDYVRLHQPHGIFTAGNIAWQIDQKASYLATKPEVLDHLRHCLDTAKQAVDVEERFGWEYVSHEESDDGVVVTLTSPEGHLRQLRAKRLIKAFGHQVMPNAPLEITSTRLRSITPELLGVDAAVLRDDDAPVWIIGSGKTAMDTAHLVITGLPGREVNMVAGPGTFFGRRETFFPTGSRRWWAGTPINAMARKLGRRFDGTNEDEVRDWFRASYGIGPTDDARDYLSAYLSDAECAVVKTGLRSVEHEYFEDAVDRDGGAELVFRSGSTRPVPAGAWVVNCTGSLLRISRPYEPFISPGGRTLALQMRSSTIGVISSFAGYYLTHLMFTDRLAGLGLYELDVEDLAGKAKPLIFYASISLTLYNASLIFDALPNKVLLACGLDYDLWYPLPRRMLGVMAFLRTKDRDRAHHRATLDTIRDRFDVRCGPLTTV